MRWSQLRSLLRDLFDPDLELDIHCTVHRGEGGISIGRYWITLDGSTIWEEPRDVNAYLKTGRGNAVASEITVVLRQYLDSPREELPDKIFSLDRWGLTEILKVADRRIGKRRLTQFKGSSNEAVQLILERRLG